jgi:hypothetical protein
MGSYIIGGPHGWWMTMMMMIGCKLLRHQRKRRDGLGRAQCGRAQRDRRQRKPAMAMAERTEGDDGGGGGNSAMETTEDSGSCITGVSTHDGQYTQYNIFGNSFEVSAKYVPPIRPIGRGAYGIVWCVFILFPSALRYLLLLLFSVVLLLLLLFCSFVFSLAAVCCFRCRWSGLLDRGDMSRTRTRCYGASIVCVQTFCELEQLDEDWTSRLCFKGCYLLCCCWCTSGSG